MRGSCDPRVSPQQTADMACGGREKKKQAIFNSRLWWVRWRGNIFLGTFSLPSLVTKTYGWHAQKVSFPICLTAVSCSSQSLATRTFNTTIFALFLQPQHYSGCFVRGGSKYNTIRITPAASSNNNVVPVILLPAPHRPIIINRALCNNKVSPPAAAAAPAP